MNRDEWLVLCAVEEHYMKKEEFPAVSTISRKTQIDQVRVVEALSNPLLQRSLDARGIPWMQVDNSLSPAQVACINLLLNISDPRSKTMKLKALGISPITFKGWQKQKHFSEAMYDQGKKLFGESVPEIHKALLEKAVDGDMMAIKQVYAMQGIWDDHKSVEQMNIKFVMVKLLEVIQSHVRDPEALQAIASEFEGLLAPSNQRMIDGRNN